MENISIGRRIKERRISLNLSLEYIANYCGVSKSTVSRWENGYIDNIKRGHIYLLSKVLFLPVNIILGIETDVQILDAELIKNVQKLEEKLFSCSIEEINKINKFIDAFILDSSKSKA